MTFDTLANLGEIKPNKFYGDNITKPLNNSVRFFCKMEEEKIEVIKSYNSRSELYLSPVPPITDEHAKSSAL